MEPVDRPIGAPPPEVRRLVPGERAIATLGGTVAAERRPLVLLVEDDTTLRDIVRRNLGVHGYRVHPADSAAAALAAVRREAPAVLLLDINLPDGTGWDVLRTVRAQGARVPTIVVSAVRCNRERLAEFRPDAYLPKPFPMAALLEAIDRLAGSGPAAPSEREGGVDMDVEAPAALPEPEAPPTVEEDGRRGLREPITYRVPRARRRSCVDVAEPVVYRVPRHRGGHQETDLEVMARSAFVRVPVSPPADRPMDTRPPAPGPIEQAVCDLLANPASGITRVTVVGAKPASVATLEALAAERGLQAVAATSPSLQRGWIRLARRAPETEAEAAAVVRDHELAPHADARTADPQGARAHGSPWRELGVRVRTALTAALS